MVDDDDRLQIGEFAALVGLSIPQLRRYDRMRLLEPEGRSDAGYRWYRSGQTGAGRVVALLRSMDMPIADVRRVLAGITHDERQQLLASHRARLEARLDEVRRLLDAVDSMIQEGTMTADPPTSWLHVMPRIPVADLDRSCAYYEEALGLRVAWRTADGRLAAVASGEIEVLLLVRWDGRDAPPSQSAYVYVDDPDAMCADCEAAGALLVDPVASRSNGMRDFVVADPDGHRFTLGRGEAALRDVAAYYGMTSDEIAIDPDWLRG